jgi:hypothetical protein
VLPPAGWTFPFWTPGLVLPKNHDWVDVQLFDANGLSVPDQFVNEFSLTLDQNVLVVPVHVHILRNNKNQAPSRYDPMFRTGTDAQIAWAVRQQFDQTAVRYAPTTIAWANNSVSMNAQEVFDPDTIAHTYTSEFTGAQLPLSGDDIYGQVVQEADGTVHTCDIQLRLASVVNKECSSQARPFNLVQSLVTSIDNSGTLPRGVHVVIGGWLGHNTDQQSRGESCVNSHFAYIDGGGIDAGFRMQTVFHEIGHILMKSGAHSQDVDNLMHATTNGALLTADQCASMRTGAATY